MTALSVALLNLKPGTGKTTSAVWLAHIFVQAGKHVLLVDADPSGSALEWSDLAAMDPGLPPKAAFPFRIVALPSRGLHQRVTEIAHADDVVIIDAPQLEDHAGIARSAMRYADEILIPCAPSPIEINRTTPVRDEIIEVEAVRDTPARSAVLLNRCIARAHSTANAREALEEVYAQGGLAISVSDEEVWAAQRTLLHLEGIYTEPAGATALAGACRAARDGRIGRGSEVVCLVTGSGFKDTDSLAGAAAPSPEFLLDPPALREQILEITRARIWCRDHAEDIGRV